MLTYIWKGEAEHSLPVSIFGMTSIVGSPLGPFIGGAIYFVWTGDESTGSRSQWTLLYYQSSGSSSVRQEATPYLLPERQGFTNLHIQMRMPAQSYRSQAFLRGSRFRSYGRVICWRPSFVVIFSRCGSRSLGACYFSSKAVCRWSSAHCTAPVSFRLVAYSWP